MKCQVKECNEEVIYSGVDGFMLNVPTETVCYRCAQIYNYVSNLKEEYYARFNKTEEEPTTDIPQNESMTSA